MNLSVEGITTVAETLLTQGLLATQLIAHSGADLMFSVQAGVDLDDNGSTDTVQAVDLKPLAQWAADNWGLLQATVGTPTTSGAVVQVQLQDVDTLQWVDGMFVGVDQGCGLVALVGQGVVVGFGG